MKKLLNSVPDNFEMELLTRYREIERNFRERRWEPAELNGGKLCEVSYAILKGHIDGSYPSTPAKPKNMIRECQELERADQKFGRSVRIQIPRMIIALYEVRNWRNVGHIGGDVDPSHMDAVCVLHIAKWIVSEFIRVFYCVSTDEATRIVEGLTERHIDVLWRVGGKTRVLLPNESMLNKALLVLYGEDEPMSEVTLVDNIEHSNASVFRRDVLRRAHRDKLLEYDERSRTVVISPLGVKRVEEKILVGASV